MKLKKGQTLEVDITDIAFGGKGLSRYDGFTVFVDQAIPGDRAEIRIIKKKKNYAQARLIHLLEPSKDRIAPPCRYSGYCGGCKWQFLSYEKQLEYKRRHVIDSLEHIGLIHDVRVNSTIPSEPIFEYRNKMEFSCSDRRWLLPEEFINPDIPRDFAIGLHVPGTFHKVIDTESCLIQPSLGNTLLAQVREYISNSFLPVYGLRTHVGFWRFLMLRYSVAYDQWMVNLITSGEQTDHLRDLAGQIRESHGQVVSVVNNVTGRKAGIAVGEYEIQLEGNTCIRDRIGDFEFDISANSFFQTNTRGAERLYDVVKRFARLTGKETVVDLYSGTGTIPIYLSHAAQTVTGIEIVDSAISDARKNCRLNGITNCQFIAGDIQDKLHQVEKKQDVIIIDPPRVGMHKSVVRQILDMGAERIVYVSCNPATLARDLGMMKDDYFIEEVQPVDMFPHTYHIESVACLVKNKKK